MKRCTKCGEEKPATTEYFYRTNNKNGGLYAVCKACISEHNREYAKTHREARLEGKRKYREAHRESLREYFRNRKRKLRETEPEKERAYKVMDAMRERARKKGLPSDFTRQDREWALEYWHGYCPVCGAPLRDLFGKVKPHFDHWIPLSDQRPDNPGTVPSNMLPVCSTCNFSKHKIDPRVWLEGKYGKRKASQIIKRIEEFFQTVRQPVLTESPSKVGGK